MLKNICGISLDNAKIYSPSQEKDLKRELTKLVYNTNDDYIINYYYNDWKKFISIINDKFNNIKNITIQEIKLINFLNKLDTISLNNVKIA